MFGRRKKIYVDNLGRTHDFRFFVIFLVLVGLVAGALYAVGYFMTRDTVPRGTTVAGVDVGGLAFDEAAERLDVRVGDRLDQPIKLRAGDARITWTPADSGVALDADATLQQVAEGSDFDPRRIWDVLVSSPELDPVLDVDTQALEQSLAGLRSKAESRPTDYQVSFASGRVRIVAGSPGGTIVTRDLLEAVTEHLAADDSGEVSAPVRRLTPDITWPEASRFASGPGEDALTSPVTLLIGRQRVTVPTGVLPAVLAARPSDGGLTLVGRGAALLRRVPSIRDAWVNPRNARMVVRNGRPVAVRGSLGRVPTVDDLGAALARAATSKNRTARVRVRNVSPRVSYGDLRQLGKLTLIGASRVRVPDSLSPRATQALARDLDGAVLMPGEQLSVLGTLTPPVTDDEGDLLASAVFDAGLKAGLNFAAWRPTDVAALPMPDGRRMRLGVRGPDLVLTGSDSGAYLRVRVEMGRGKGRTAVLHVQVWGRKPGKTVIKTGPRRGIVRPRTVTRSGRPCRARPALPGYTVIVRQQVDLGRTTQRRQFVSAYRARSGVRCTGGNRRSEQRPNRPGRR